MSRLCIDLAGYPVGMDFRKGDKVTWKSHGSTVTGTVEEKTTSDTKAAGRTVRASDDEPQYRVRSDKSGRDAVHKPESLRRSK
jgi:Hypervirulence associated proteins TUDOR domain